MKETINLIKQQLEHTLEKVTQHPADQILVDKHPKLQLELLAKGLVLNSFTSTEMRKIREHEESESQVKKLEDDLSLESELIQTIKSDLGSSKTSHLEKTVEPETKKLTGTEIPYNQIYKSAQFESVGPDNVATFHTKSREERNLEALKTSRIKPNMNEKLIGKISKDQKNSMISAVDNLEVEVPGESNFEKLTQFASSSFQRALSDAKKVIERDELIPPTPAKTLEKDHFNLLK
jgi:hypothetical protein